MGVRLNVSKTYRTSVNFQIMTADGKQEAQSFEAEFKRLTREEVGELIASKANDSDMLREVLVGWKMIDLGTNEATEFSPENFETFLSIPGAAGVTMLRFMETVGANRAKN